MIRRYTGSLTLEISYNAATRSQDVLILDRRGMVRARLAGVKLAPARKAYLDGLADQAAALAIELDEVAREAVAFAAYDDDTIWQETQVCGDGSKARIWRNEADCRGAWRSILREDRRD